MLNVRRALCLFDNVIYRTSPILVRSHKHATKSRHPIGQRLCMGLNFGAELSESLPQLVIAVTHAHLIGYAGDKIPFMSSSFDVRDTLLLAAGKGLTEQSATATGIPTGAFHRLANQCIAQIVLGFVMGQLNHTFIVNYPASRAL